MGFFDDFRDGFEKETKKSTERQSYSRYRTAEEEAQEMQRKFESYSDSRLLNAVKSAFTSNEEKRVIHNILLRRGYTKVGNDYRRR